jgi:DNA-binding response OmpR family regulator
MKILLVDDDLQLATIIAFTLQREGYTVVTAHDGASALRLWEQEQPHLVLLDVNMPPPDGYEVLRRIRAVGNTPVVMLTVRNAEEDTVAGLDLGADDYISKPFSPRTLLARLRAVLRRVGEMPADDLTFGDLTMDIDRQEVRRGNEPSVKLTPLEFRLLHYLWVNQNRVLSNDALIEHVWGYGDTGDKMLLKQLVRRLRRKIEPDPTTPRYLQNVAGVGYVLEDKLAVG